MKATEQFKIHDTIYSIDQNFAVWRGGCRIFTGEDIDDARRMLHTYACNQMAAEIGCAERRLEQTKYVLDLIKGDPFYLGRVLI